VRYVPAWQTPIDVQLGTQSAEGQEPQNAVTYGLVCTELVEAEWPGRGFPPRLVERLGLGNLVNASREIGRFSDASRDPVKLARHMRRFVDDELAALVAPILSTATASGSLEHDPSNNVVALIAARGPSTAKPRRLIHNDRIVWGQTFGHILERAAAEVFELYATRARVRRCRFCNSVFVPRRGEHVCRWNLWSVPMRVGDPALRLCSPERAAEVARDAQPQSARAAYDKERKRLWARYDRAKKAAIDFGENPDTSSPVRNAAKALSEFIAQNGPTRGRPRTRTDPANIRDDPTTGK